MRGISIAGIGKVWAVPPVHRSTGSPVHWFIMEIGLYSFVEIPRDPATGLAALGAQRMRDLLEEIELADQVGLDVFGVGEHHRPEFIASAPAVVLAAAAARTKRIRLTSAVTVLSSDDPVRVFEEFSTLDLISGGRAEIMAGRGSFIESFPLFGYDLADYDDALRRKARVVTEAARARACHWSGDAPAGDQGPRCLSAPDSRTASGVDRGGRNARVDYPRRNARPSVGAGHHRRRAGAVRAAHRSLSRGRQAGGARNRRARVGINSHTFIATDGREAANTLFPPYAEAMSRIGRERGWPPTTRQQFDASRAPHGSLLVGSAQEVIDKILYEHELFDHDRFLAQMTVGPVPHEKVMRSIELLGTVVAPAIRKATGG